MPPNPTRDPALEAALALHRAGRLADADDAYAAILARRPGERDALHMRGLVRMQRGDPRAGAALMERALASGEDPLLLCNLGLALMGQGLPQAAAPRFARAIALSPRFADAHGYLGLSLAQSGRLDESLAAYAKAIEIDPSSYHAFANRAATLAEAGRAGEALEDADRAIALAPDRPEGHANRAAALFRLSRFAESAKAADEAIARAPTAEAHALKGAAEVALGHDQAALASLDRALAAKPRFAAALANRAVARRRLRDASGALDDTERALAIDPGLALLPGYRLHDRLAACAWDGLDAIVDGVTGSLASGRDAANPFVLLAAPVGPEIQRSCARIFSAARYPARAVAPPAAGATRRLRLGYFSSDFRDHAVAHLIAGVIESHDRGSFEVVGFAWGPASDDAYRRRLARGFDRLVDLSTLDDASAADVARTAGIDIAINLNGYTEHERTGIFAHRPCPLQVQYLGYIGTMGTGLFDHVIADRIALPPWLEPHFDEKPILLPRTFQATDRRKARPGNLPDRASLGLPEDGVVFCCFNNAFKITPDAFDAWSRLLREVAGSALWLADPGDLARQNLRREAARRGVRPERLVFARRAPLEDYLARLAVADLYLDTFHYNAGTMASDALWMGLPVVTRAGATFASRMAASVLCAADLPELVSATTEEYVELARGLATDGAARAALRERLARSRPDCALFDTAGFTRDLEAGLRAAWRDAVEGRAPRRIEVSARQ